MTDKRLLTPEEIRDIYGILNDNFPYMGKKDKRTVALRQLYEFFESKLVAKVDRLRLNKPDRTKLQHLFCQHCKALQKTNDTVVECWYNPLDYDGVFAFCAANEDAINQILAQCPDIENLDELRTRLTELEKKLDDREVDLIEAKREILDKIETTFSDTITKGEMTATNAWQALRE